MIEFKIKEGSETAPDLEKIIVRSGDTNEFTLQEIESNILYLLKKQKELTSQKGIQGATKSNIERTHPHIAKMTQEDLTAAYLYREAVGVLNVTEQQLSAIEKGLKEYAEDKAAIAEKLGVKVPEPEVEVKKDESKLE